MKSKIVETYTVRLYMAGDIEQAKQVLREECYRPNLGLCVTIEPTLFIYTGGQEDGFVVGFINYPRFPSTPKQLYDRALVIANRLISRLCQWSAMLVTPEKTVWITCRPEEQEA